MNTGISVILAGAMMTATMILAAPASAGDIASSVSADTLPEKKHTPLNLYLTPADAHVALQADPSIVFIDVRDPVEVSFVGHPEGMDSNTPIRVVSHRFDSKAGKYKMDDNANFLAEIAAVIEREGADKASPIFLICRSGVRSAVASRKLIDAGYTNVWNLIEGFEGDKDKTTRERTVNGWRNAGLPWAYKLGADEAWRPTE